MLFRSSGAVTITLPTISTVEDGFKVAIVKWTSDGNAVSVVRSSTNTINGATSYNLGNQYSSATFVADLETGQWFAVASGLGVSNVAVDAFSGNNSTVAFTLSGDPGSENNTQVFVSGVYQEKDTYSVSGTTLTFSTAPPTGTSNIEVVWTAPLAIGTPSDGTVTTAKLSSTTGSGAVVLATSPTITTPTISGDATISGLTVGKGGGAVSTNTAVGASALSTNSTGSSNTALGYQTLQANTGSNNLAVGYQSGYSNTSGDIEVVGYQAGYSNVTGTRLTGMGYQSMYYQTGSYNTAFGFQSLYGASGTSTGNANLAVGFKSLVANTSGNYNIAIGNEYTGNWAAPLAANTTGGTNIAIGTGALSANTTSSANIAIGYTALNSSTGANNVAVGYQSLYGITSATYNTAVGFQAGFGANSQGFNTWIGYQCGYSTTAAEYNVAVGAASGYNITTGDGNICIQDYSARGYQIFNVTSENDRVVMGHTFVSNAYIKVAWTVTSDARDKTDITPATYGLDFVTKLKPITFRWDERVSYANKTPDGSKKKLKTQLGFLAQDVIALEKEFGAVDKDLLVADDEQEDNLKITETKMIPVLVKAIQELKAINDTQAKTINALTARVTALEGN